MLQRCSYSLHLSLGLQMCITRPGFMCGSWELNSGSYTKLLMITQVIGTLPADLSSHIWSESMFKVLPLPVGICFPLALQCILLQCSWVCFYFVIIYWQCLLPELWHFLSWHLCWIVNLCRYGRTGSRNMHAKPVSHHSCCCGYYCCQYHYWPWAGLTISAYLLSYHTSLTNHKVKIKLWGRSKQQEQNGKVDCNDYTGCMIYFYVGWSFYLYILGLEILEFNP